MSDDKPVDIFATIETGAATGVVETGSLLCRMETNELGAEAFGFNVHKDGAMIALAAGTTWEAEQDHDERFYIHQGLSPEQARELATALSEVADEAEKTAEKQAGSAEYSTDSQSLVDRLLGRSDS